MSGPSDPAGARPGGAARAGVGLVWGAGHGGIAAVGVLGASPADGWGGADLVYAAGASAGPVPASEGRGRDVGPYAGAGAGGAVDVCGGSRGGAHQQPGRART